MASCWPVASVPLGLCMGLSSRLCLTPWRLASPTMGDSREQGGSYDGFYGLASEVTHHHVHQLLLVTQASSDSVERVLKRHEWQTPRITGDHLGGWLPHNTPSFVYMISFSLHNEGLRLIYISQGRKPRLREGK